jgi:hypothetical protein
VSDTAPSSHSKSELPEVVARYQDAHDRHDTDIALSAFTAGATVLDEGREYHGTDQIRTWLMTAGAALTFPRTFVSAEATGGGVWVVVNRLDGDFPGGVVDLRYRYVLTGGLISELVIAP